MSRRNCRSDEGKHPPFDTYWRLIGGQQVPFDGHLRIVGRVCDAGRFSCDEDRHEMASESLTGTD